MDRLLLKQKTIDSWSLKEQLGLASAVLRSGDQNWVSVSRQMKPFSEDGRPADWFSQKNCALQYNQLLGKTDTPRRKRGEKAIESVETPGEAIVKRLTSDRIKELRKIIEAETNELLQLEEECKLLSDENISEEKLREIEANLDREEKEEAERKASYEKWLKEREEQKQAIQAALKAHTSRLPLKGAAAAAVQQAGAARRASTQSERSSFSEVDSPSAVNVVPIENIEPSTPKKEIEIETAVEVPKIEPPPIIEKELPKSPNPNVEHDITPEVVSPTKEPGEIDLQPETEEAQVDPEEVNQVVKVENTENVEEVADVEMAPITEKEEKQETTEEVCENKSVEEDEDIKAEISSVSNAPSTEEKTEDEEDDEVILKKDVTLDISIGSSIDEDDSKKNKSANRPSRSKKISEVSEEDEANDDVNKPKRETRSKKISERSDDLEESPAPPLRSTRRSRKTEESTSAERDEAVDKRLSRVKETDTRGRRGSGTASRSSSPVGSGEEESEADLTPTRGSRSRKKSGRTPTNASGGDIESAPPSPSVSGITETSEDSITEEWRRSAISLITQLKNHNLGEKVFSVVAKTNEDSAKKVVLKDMDLSMIKKDLENGSILTNSELHKALNHTFLNIIMSISSETEEFEMALTLFRDCQNIIDDNRSLSLPVKSSPSKSSSKSRERKDSKRGADEASSSSSKRRKR